MKARAFFYSLVAALFCCLTTAFDQSPQAKQTNFVTATPSPQNRAQNPPRLPPEKRRSLSKYGPEDVFPGAREQDEENRSASRSSRAARKSPTPNAAPQPSPALAAATATPVPTLNIVAATALQQSAIGAVPAPVAGAATTTAAPTRLVTIALIAAALLVLAALLYVLSKLKHLLRVGSAG